MISCFCDPDDGCGSVGIFHDRPCHLYVWRVHQLLQELVSGELQIALGLLAQLLMKIGSVGKVVVLILITEWLDHA